MADLSTDTSPVLINDSGDLRNHLINIGASFPDCFEEQNRLLLFAMDSDTPSPFENVSWTIENKKKEFIIKLSVKHSAGSTMEETFEFNKKKGFDLKMNKLAKESFFMLISYIKKQSLDQVFMSKGGGQQDVEKGGFGNFIKNIGSQKKNCR